MIELERGWFMRLVDRVYNAGYWLSEHAGRVVKVGLLLLGAFLLGSWLASCLPADARADSDPRPRFTVSTAKVAAGVFRLYVGITCTGGPDSVHVQTRSPLTGNILAHKLTGCPARDSFDLSAPDVGLTVRDTLSGYTIRRGLRSITVKVPWSYTEADGPPPPPVITPDSTLKVSALEVVPGSVTMAPGASQQFCALLVFTTGQKAIIGGQRGIATCEAVEAALPLLQRASTAQYTVAATWLSCVNTATGKTCRNATGGTVLVQRPGPVIRLASGV